MLEEIKKYYNNGNVYSLFYKDEQSNLQGTVTYFFYNNKIASTYIYKDDIACGIGQFFFYYDVNNLSYARHYMKIYKNGVDHGIKLNFNYE